MISKCRNATDALRGDWWWRGNREKPSSRTPSPVPTVSPKRRITNPTVPSVVRWDVERGLLEGQLADSTSMWLSSPLWKNGELDTFHACLWILILQMSSCRTEFVTCYESGTADHLSLMLVFKWNSGPASIRCCAPTQSKEPSGQGLQTSPLNVFSFGHLKRPSPF